MKVKLLKKVRKRFEIIHYPKGFYSCNEFYNYNVFRLNDKNDILITRGDVQYCKTITEKKYGSVYYFTEIECINYLKSKIVAILKSEGYASANRSRINKTSKKIWYNKF